MKSYFYFFFIILFATKASAANLYVESSGAGASYSTVLQIDENSTLVVLAFSSQNPTTNGSDANTWFEIEATSGNWLTIHSKPNGPSTTRIKGPAKVRLAATSGYYVSYVSGKILMNYDIISNQTNSSASTSNEKKFATVIPENSSTNVRVVLEQSTDLINWTTVNPGVFTPSTSKRFFRVRSEEE